MLQECPETNSSSDCASEAISSVAQVLKSAADPLRMEILSLLRTDSFGVLELVSLFDVKQSGMSHHLKVLANADLVTTRREGNSIFYLRKNASDTSTTNDGIASTDETITTLRKHIFECADKLKLTQNVQNHLNNIYQQRAEASAAFFIHHAEKFREQQELIANFDTYAKPMAQWLSSLEQKNRVLEVGPGTGDFLPTLSEHFRHVIALDTSKAMLYKSKEQVKKHHLNNIELILGDTEYCQNLDSNHLFDCVVVNMVLHHTSSPSQIISDLSRAIKPGGYLLLSDLCPHDQDWTREACGDQWLGFKPEDIKQWCQNNHLEETQHMYIALRNGFQIQIRQFNKIH